MTVDEVSQESSYVKRTEAGLRFLSGPVGSDECAQWLRTPWLGDQSLQDLHVGNIDKALLNVGLIAVKKVLANCKSNVGVDRLKTVRLSTAIETEKEKGC